MFSGSLSDIPLRLSIIRPFAGQLCFTQMRD
jgi:hypothetical protein